MDADGEVSMLVRPIDQATAADVDTAGGKGANLGELTRAGFPVPEGFIVTTEAYLDAARAARVDPHDPGEAAERLRRSAVPDAIAAAATEAYAALGGGPVAVRSSATAEDLPGASFAGQQDTYLNIEGDAALLDAIRRCWASLWNERAVAYRRANGIDDGGVSLAVVVQRMVPASAAGVLFTADPVTGRRRCAAIDAVAELGERLVSGAVNPDHYLIDTRACHVLERQPVGEASVLSDQELLHLALLGDRVERHFGAPQDIEFALDAGRRAWLVQSRPITTLYPLPVDAPDPPQDLRVYFSVNVFQGYFEPITPMGIQFFHLLGTAVIRRFGGQVADATAGPRNIVDAGMRLYVDVTPVVRDPVGRRLFVAITSVGESRSSAVISRLTSRSALRAGQPIAPAQRAADRRTPHARRSPAGRAPDAAVAVCHASAERAGDQRDRPHRPAAGCGRRRPAGRLRAAAADGAVGDGATPAGDHRAGHALARARRAAAARPGTHRRDPDRHPQRTAQPDHADGPGALVAECRRSAPTRRHARRCSSALPRTSPTPTSRGGSRPKLQDGLATFLKHYGFRSIGEIDIGVRRWSEDPTHILGALANYVRFDDDALDPDALFAKGERDAEAMVTSLIARVHGPRRLAVRFALGRVRELIGSREAPKFHLIRLLATPSRDLLKPVGAELAEAGRIAEADDIFFLTLPEARRAVAGDDLRDVVAARRETFRREQARRHLPRVLLSDGTDAEAALVSVADGGLRGSPASPAWSPAPRA